MIYVRDDDVLIDSRSYPDPLKRFQQLQRWICQDPHFLHVPAILMYQDVSTRHRGLIGFPEAVEYMQEEVDQGRMRVEIHGYEHIDYGKVSIQRARDDLRRMQDYIVMTFGTEPTTWYTPWGASQPHLHEAAGLEKLKLVDTSKVNKLQGRYGVCRHLMDGGDLKRYEEDEIFLHWYDGGMRLQRVIKAHLHGGWHNAARIEPELFK